jgi:hypothetical protein
MPSAEEHLDSLLLLGDQAAWTTAALVTALRARGPEAGRQAARDVLRAVGLDVPDAVRARDSAGVVTQATAPALAAGRRPPRVTAVRPVARASAGGHRCAS